MARFVLILLVLADSYALVRYHVFKGIPLAQWPLFLNNKAVSLTALVLLSWVLMPRRAGSGDRIPQGGLGRMAMLLASLHGLASAGLFARGAFPSLVTHGWSPTGRGALVGGLGFVSLAAGLAAMATFRRVAAVPGSALRQRARSLTQVSLATGSAHVAVLGWKGWLEPQLWPGGLPPISLIAFLATLAPLGILTIRMTRPWIGRRIHALLPGTRRRPIEAR